MSGQAKVKQSLVKQDSKKPANSSPAALHCFPVALEKTVPLAILEWMHLFLLLLTKTLVFSIFVSSKT